MSYSISNAIVGLCISLSNAYGLLLLTFFLGHAIVAYPVHLWHKGDNERKLRLYEKQVVDMSDLRDDSEEVLKNMLRKANYLDTQVRSDHQFRPLIDVIVKTASPMMEQFPTATVSSSLKGHRRTISGTIVDEEGSNQTTQGSFLRKLRNFIMSLMGIQTSDNITSCTEEFDIYQLTRKQLVQFHHDLMRSIWHYNKTE